jgi:hypothetical protein
MRAPHARLTKTFAQQTNAMVKETVSSLRRLTVTMGTYATATKPVTRRWAVFLILAEPQGMALRVKMATHVRLKTNAIIWNAWRVFPPRKVHRVMQTKTSVL